MNAKLRLEVFDTPETLPPGMVVLDAEQLEEHRIAAYEAGYKAGWEDASAASAAEQGALRADVARNLQAMSFTYHEARTQILRALEPLLAEIAARLLPEIARAALPGQISAILLPLAEQRTEVPVTLAVNPAARTAIEALVSTPSGLPLVVVENPDLGPGQASLRLGEVETRIDLDAAVAAIRSLVRDFFDMPRKERKYG